LSARGQEQSSLSPIFNLCFPSTGSLKEFSLPDQAIISSPNSFLNPNNLASQNTTPQRISMPLYTNKLVSAVSHQQVSCLCLLEILISLDSINHSLLANQISSWFGVSLLYWPILVTLL